MKKNIRCLVLVIIFCQAFSVAFSQKTFIREIFYTINEDQTTEEVRRIAINELKSRLSDEMGGYIVSQTTMKQVQKDYEYSETFEHQVQNLSLNYMRVFVEEEKHLGDRLYLKARIEVDDDEIDRELEKAGLSDRRELLKTVIALMELSNVGAYDYRIVKSVEALLANHSTIQDQKDQSFVKQLIVKNNGQLFDGQKCLDGTFELLFRTGIHAQFTIRNGFLEGEYHGYNSQGLKIVEGIFKKSFKDGTWKVFSDGNLLNQFTYVNGYLNGESSWYAKGDEQPFKIINYKKDVPQNKIVIEEENRRQIQREGDVDKHENWNGLRISKDRNSNIVEKAAYKNGKRHGSYFSYYPEGEVDTEGHYEEDQRIGNFRSYYTNGQLKSVIEYKSEMKEVHNYQKYYENGNPKEFSQILPNGHLQEENYFESGQIRSRREFLPQGRVVLNYTDYYENGNIKEVKKLLSGDRFSVEAFYESGKPERVGNYIGSNRHGVFQTYYNNGQLKSETHYVDDKQEGIYRFFNEDGAPLELKTFKTINGRVVKDGLFKVWIDGFCYKEEMYKEGKRNGVFKTFYARTEQLRKVEEYVDDEYHGYVKDYFENGVQSDQKQYIRGKRVGQWFSINSAGEEEHLAYKDDKIIFRKRSRANGQVTEEEYPLNGKTGTQKEYYPNGTLKQIYAVEGYSQNSDRLSRKKCGVDKVYFQDGTLQYERNWLNDKLDGLNTTYSKTGEKINLTFYTNGRKDGKSLELSKSEVKSAGAYQRNLKVGNWYLFKHDGNVEIANYNQSGRKENIEIISDLNEIKEIKENIEKEWKRYLD